MKTKIISTLIIISFVFTLLPCGVCFGADPGVTREYISRKAEGVKSEEERVSVDYTDLRIKSGDYLRISFLDANDSVLYEYETDLTGNEFLEDGMFFNTQRLPGTEFIKIEFISQDEIINGIKVPLKI